MQHSLTDSDDIDIFENFGKLSLEYNKELATIEIFEDEQLLFSVFESEPNNANWNYVEKYYEGVFEAIHRVNIGRDIYSNKQEIEI